MIGGPLPAVLLPVITNPPSGSCWKIGSGMKPVGAPAVERMVSLIATVCDVPSVIAAILTAEFSKRMPLGGVIPAGGIWTTE